MMLYVVARSAVSKRPMCQHLVVDAKGDAIITACNRAISNRSSEYTEMPLHSIMCQRCKKKEEVL